MSQKHETRPLLPAIDFILPRMDVESIHAPSEEANKPKHDKPKFVGVTLQTWDRLSSGLSFICLVLTGIFWRIGKGKHKVDINREMLMYSNKSTFIEHMRFMQRGYKDYCPGVMPKYVQPDWKQDSLTTKTHSTPESEKPKFLKLRLIFFETPAQGNAWFLKFQNFLFLLLEAVLPR